MSYGDNLQEVSCHNRTMYNQTYSHVLPVSIHQINNDIAAYDVQQEHEHNEAEQPETVAEAPIPVASSEPVDDKNSRRTRTAFSGSQYEALEKIFKKTMYLNRPDRQDTARRLSLSDRQVKIWFQNRRQKFKKESLDVNDQKLKADAAKMLFRRNMHKSIVQRLLTFARVDADSTTNTNTNKTASNIVNKQTWPLPLLPVPVPVQYQPTLQYRHPVPYYHPVQPLHTVPTYQTGYIGHLGYYAPQIQPPLSQHAPQIPEMLPVLPAQPSFNSKQPTSTSVELTEVLEVLSQPASKVPTTKFGPILNKDNCNNKNNNKAFENIKRQLETAAEDWRSSYTRHNVPQNSHIPNDVSQSSAVAAPTFTNLYSSWKQ